MDMTPAVTLPKSDAIVAKARVGETLVVRVRVVSVDGETVSGQIVGSVERFKAAEKRVSPLDYLKSQNQKPINPIKRLA